MRITGGALRGRVLRAPAGLTTRPTSDRVRQALFNVLLHNDWGRQGGANGLEGLTILDAFAGTGALGLEALSHGAGHALFFEKERAALAALRANIEALGLKAKTDVFEKDVCRSPAAPSAAAVVFFDPPYRKGLIERAYAALFAQGWIASGALLVCETAKDEALALPSSCVPLFSRLYGDTQVQLFRAQM